jgi:hypothetical protein
MWRVNLITPGLGLLAQSASIYMTIAVAAFSSALTSAEVEEAKAYLQKA